MVAGEFELIARHFARLSKGAAGAFALENDAALLDLEADQSLVVTIDTLVAGRHFRTQDPPDLVAGKLLRVNLSDLAAMGARPKGYVLAASWPDDVDEAWIEAFARGLSADQANFGITLLGGDTTATPGPMTLSLTAFGVSPRGRALVRSGARIGDLVCVSGYIGDAALGLKVLTGALRKLPEETRAYLVSAYQRPEPRLDLGWALLESGLATAALDVSDGLVGDLAHIAEASSLAAQIEVESVPLSEAARRILAAEPGALSDLLTGGDDYELLFTLAPARRGELTGLSEALGLPLTVIGRMEPGTGVSVFDEEGRTIPLARTGWTHF
jgi:thiamine-monophosphate kinase